MFANKRQLPHLLSPGLYSCPEQYERELVQLFASGWQLVGSLADAPAAGDYFTVDLLGQPLLIRNFGGRWQAFLNVCPHRHSLLTHERQGHSPTLKCQYHGWEFQEDGRTGKIPEAQDFKPWVGGPECLRRYRTAVYGPLIFVTLNDLAPDLPLQFGILTDVCNEFPAQRWRQACSWSYEFEANWKVVVENTIESYHVEEVHPRTLISFGSEKDIEHEFHDQVAIMRCHIASPAVYRRITDWLLPLLEPNYSHEYRLYHAYPNAFVIRIDAMLQAMFVTPTSPQTCRLTVFVFTLRSQRETWHSRLATWGWGSFKTWIVKRVLAEDAGLYPDLQRGLNASPFRGALSAREELIHAFQDYVLRGCAEASVGQSGI